MPQALYVTSEAQNKEADLIERNLEYIIGQETTPPDVRKQLEYMLDARDNIASQLDQDFWKLMAEDYLRSQALPSIPTLSYKLNLQEASWRHPASFLEKADLEELKEMIGEVHAKIDRGLDEMIIEEKARTVQSPGDWEEVRRLYLLLIDGKKHEHFTY